MVTRCLPFHKMTAQQQIDHLLLCHGVGWVGPASAEVAHSGRRIMHTTAHSGTLRAAHPHTHDKDPQ